MSNADYSKALTAAQKELESLSTQAEIIERRRAQLQQTISSLKILMNVAEDEERTLTDCIRIAVKGAQGYIAAGDVLKAVIAMGAPFSGKNMIDSVVTILNRLQKQDELLRDPNGRGYMWVGYAANVVADRALGRFGHDGAAEMLPVAKRGRTAPSPPGLDDLPAGDPSHPIHRAGPIAKVTKTEDFESKRGEHKLFGQERDGKR
jgi:hypothetical protein